MSNSAFTVFGNSAGSGGTVSTINVGTGLKGGPITTIGTINLANNNFATGRLTLATGVPVTVTNQSSSTLYYTPYLGSYLSLYNGATWDTYNFAETSIAIPSTTSTMYDVFAFNNSGVIGLNLVAWTNDTTRATAITMLQGVWVNSSDNTQRYLGSFRTSAVSGVCLDELTTRHIWNFNNRVVRPFAKIETTASWTYSTATYRQANNSAANQLDFIVGVSEDTFQATISTMANSNGGHNIGVGIGIDSTTATSGTPLGNFQPVNNGSVVSLNASYNGYIAVGRHIATWLEIASGVGTATWYGTGTQNSVPYANGIIGTFPM